MLLQILTKLDHAVFSWINGLPHTKLLDSFVVYVGDIKSENIYFFIGLLVLYGAFFKNQKLWKNALILFVAFVLVNHFVVWAKDFFDRSRPALVLPNVYMLGARGVGPALPSIAAANAALLTSFIYFVQRKQLIFLASFTVLLGCFRVYQGLHFPADILAGWILGISVAFAAFLFSRFIGFNK